MTLDAILKFVILDPQTGKASCRFHVASCPYRLLEELGQDRAMMRLEGAIATNWIYNIRMDTFSIRGNRMDFTIDFELRDWPEIRTLRRGFLHEPVRLVLERMQGELFHEEQEPVGVFINQRMRRDASGIRRSML